jgi:predicted nucleic acid-binding protein
VTVILDTDVAIEILRARNQVISSKWSALVASGAVVLYSPVIAAEVWAGALPHEHQLISTFFRPLICIPTDYEIGELAGELLRRFAKSHSLEIPDALIAATAIQHRAALWTRNRKHYAMPQLTFYT